LEYQLIVLSKHKNGTFVFVSKTKNLKLVPKIRLRKGDRINQRMFNTNLFFLINFTHLYFLINFTHLYFLINFTHLYILINFTHLYILISRIFISENFKQVVMSGMMKS